LLCTEQSSDQISVKVIYLMDTKVKDVLAENS